MKPEEIGDLLGTDSESVVVAREGALEQLATELDMDNVAELDQVRTRLAELPAEAWTGAPGERPKLSVVKEKPAEPTAKGRRSRLPLLLALLAVAAVALIGVLASSGSSDKPKSSAQTSTPAPSSPQKPAKKPKPAKAPTVQQTP
ncbi:MAG: hypothetical protein QOI19_1038, partial [Thermoleophilaceae bacterium]|nr:hypothetical protein [Thermoleophilaceae bacterium]